MSVTNPPKDMNTSKSLLDILEELQQPSKMSYPGERLKRRKAAAAAIVEAVEGLINVADSNCMDCNDLARLRQAIKEWQ